MKMLSAKGCLAFKTMVLIQLFQRATHNNKKKIGTLRQLNDFYWFQ